MDIGWIGWKGKGNGDKAKDDKDKIDGKAKDKSADTSSGAKSEKTEKKCYWCRPRGHFQADCCFKKEYEKGKGSVNSVEDGKEKARHWRLTGCSPLSVKVVKRPSWTRARCALPAHQALPLCLRWKSGRG